MFGEAAEDREVLSTAGREAGATVSDSLSEMSAHFGLRRIAAPTTVCP